jgi:hypothetical protein
MGDAKADTSASSGRYGKCGFAIAEATELRLHVQLQSGVGLEGSGRQSMGKICRMMQARAKDVSQQITW